MPEQEKMMFVECLMPEGGRLRGYGTYEQGEIAEVPESVGTALVTQTPHQWKKATKKAANEQELEKHPEKRKED